MGPQTADNIVAAYGKLAVTKARPHHFRHAKASLLNRGADVPESWRRSNSGAAGRRSTSSGSASTSRHRSPGSCPHRSDRFVSLVCAVE